MLAIANAHVRAEWKHSARKLRSTIRILFTLGMARTFGEYVHSVYSDGFDYAVYRWRGRCWAVPTTAISKLEEN